jgi:hypothetical protein
VQLLLILLIWLLCLMGKHDGVGFQPQWDSDGSQEVPRGSRRIIPHRPDSEKLLEALVRCKRRIARKISDRWACDSRRFADALASVLEGRT